MLDGVIAQDVIHKWSSASVAVRVILALLAGAALAYLLFGLLPALFPRRCPRCRKAMTKTVERLYQGEKRPEVVLPPIDLSRWTCPACGHEQRRVEGSVGLTWFETGRKSRWPGGLHGETPAEVKSGIRSVIEWDRILARLKKEYETS